MDYFTKGFISSGFLNLSPSEAYKEILERNAVILDVRETSFTRFKKFNVPEVIYIPFSNLSDNTSEIPGDKPVIVADSVGLRSHDSMLILTEKGFTNLANLAGGITEWERDGLPVKKDISEQLDGSCICQLKPRH